MGSFPKEKKTTLKDLVTYFFYNSDDDIHRQLNVAQIENGATIPSSLSRTAIPPSKDC